MLRHLAGHLYRVCTELPTATVEKDVKFPKGRSERAADYKSVPSTRHAGGRSSVLSSRADGSTMTPAAILRLSKCGGDCNEHAK